MKKIIKKISIAFILIIIYCLLCKINTSEATEIKYIQDDRPEKMYCFGSLPATQLNVSNRESYNDIIVVEDGYIVVGCSTLYLEQYEKFTEQAKGSVDAIIVKYDKNLGMKSFQSFGGNFNDYFYSIDKTTDGGYLVYGQTNSSDQDLLGKNNQTNQYVNLCVKYDSNFKVEFIETGEIPNHTDIILQDDAGKITDGKIELVRFAGDLIEPVTNPIGGEINTRINKYDCQGYPEWTKTFDRNSSKTNDKLTRVVESDGKYIFIGNSTVEVIRNSKYVEEAIIVEYTKPQSDILLNSYYYNVEKYDMIEPIAYVNYLDVKEDEIKWTSSDEDVVKIDEKGRIIAVGVGNAKLKLRIRNKETKYDVNVEVEEGLAVDSKIKEFSSDNDMVKVMMQGTEDNGQTKQMLGIFNNYREMEYLSDLTLDSYLMQIAQTRAAELHFLESDERPNGMFEINDMLPENKKDLKLRVYYFCGSYKWDEENTPNFYQDSMSPTTKGVGMSHFKVGDKMYHVFVFADEVMERYTKLNSMVYSSNRYTEVLTKYLDEAVINENHFTLTKGETNSDIEITSGEWKLGNNTFEWSSLNEDVATVDEYGRISAVGGGNTIIIAKIGDMQFKISVQVDVPLESISLNQSDILLTNKETYKLEVSFNPIDSTIEKNIIWTSSDSSIVEVNEDGIITPIKSGTATITANVDGKTATCEVTVKMHLKGDMDGNEKITPYDALLINVIYEQRRTPTAEELEIGDIDGNGRLTPYDALLINVAYENRISLD